MAGCLFCSKSSPLIAEALGVCAGCIKGGDSEVLGHLRTVHRATRGLSGLPEEPPRDEEGIRCGLCVNGCVIGEGRRGYCGARLNNEDRLLEGGNLTWYYDGLPTNCVAAWVCAATTGCGYPQYALKRDGEWGYRNLAVFYNSCTFDCLFCQNWQWKKGVFEQRYTRSDDLAGCVDERTSCICFFGGDPTPQILHALRACETAQRIKRLPILRICWETNGSMATELCVRMVDVSLRTGGTVKFDLKAYSEELHVALTGVTNSRTFENFSHIGGLVKRRREPPLLAASTLLVPGYVDTEEIEAIARFIAEIDQNIPYSLLAFYPSHHLKDLPPTSRKHAERCKRAALAQGLKRVNVGNTHLLGDYYD